MMDLSGKKLLIISGDGNDTAIVKEAKAMGIYTICCDRITNWEKSPAKLEADEVWDVDYSDTDRVVDLCRKNGVDGVIAGYSEWRVKAAAKISNVLGTPFYATEEQVELTSDKRAFKDQCLKSGVPIPKDYCFTLPLSEDDRKAIQYPVIVKPADSGGRCGISVCEEESQLDAALEFALTYSAGKKVIVEKFFVGTELASLYTVIDGEISLSIVYEKNKTKEYSALSTGSIVPSRFYEKYKRTVDSKLRRFISDMEIKNGAVSFQMIANDEEIVVFEMGYRINGANSWIDISHQKDINFMRMLIHYSLTGSMGDDINKDRQPFKQYIFTLVLYAHAGIIAKIDYQKLQNVPEIINISCKHKVGTEIKESGTSKQRCAVIKIHADSKDELIKTINFAQKNFIIEDTDGNSMLFDAFDSHALEI